MLAENYYSRFGDLARFGKRFRRQRFAIYDGRWKLIAGSDGSIELFDLDADGAELVDMGAEQEALVETLIERLMSTRAMAAYEGERVLPGQLTPAQVQDMDALGYGGGK